MGVALDEEADENDSVMRNPAPIAHQGRATGGQGSSRATANRCSGTATHPWRPSQHDQSGPRIADPGRGLRRRHA